MKILISLSYYTPYISGVTIYAKRLAEALTKKGHQVSILTSRHQPDLKKNEVIEKVKIKRIPVLFKIGKGNLMPLWLIEGLKLIVQSNRVVFHLPQVEAATLAVLAKITKKRVFVIYHCDVVLPKSLFNFFQEKIVFLSGFLTCLLADKIVSYTADYGLTSPLLKFFKKKLVFVLPPIKIETSGQKEINSVRKKMAREKNEVIIGFAGRIAAEKGIEYLFEAVDILIQKGYRLKIALAGPEKKVIGEEKYIQKIKKLSQGRKKEIIFLGNLNQKEMMVFYKQIDVLALPSLNRTESFGLVQAEAMLAGAPVIASDLPGIRMPIKLTGMGEVVEAGNSRSLAKAIEKILKNKSKYIKPKKQIKKIFSFQKTILAYEDLFLGKN